MSSEYSYNAPQFYSNLTEAITLSDDEYFDTSEEKERNLDQVKNTDVDLKNKENLILISDSEESLNDSFSRIKIRNKFEGIDLTIENEMKSHPMLTRQDVCILSPKLSLELRNRSVLKEVVVSRAVQIHPISRKRKAENSICQGNGVVKFRSLAESIYHFQKDTPPRFRGVSKKHSGLRHIPGPATHSAVTVPETPRFLSQQRLRHCTQHCLSQEERELQEIEEAKQNFKPQPLNKKIFDPLKVIDREKNITIPKPFKLSDPPSKKIESKEEIFVFKAKPLPPNIYNMEGLRRVSTKRLPVLLEENENEDSWNKDEMVSGYKEGVASCSTQVKPFSFDERDKLRAIRKIERINKIKENEKKATVFKAQPLPSYVTDALKHSTPSSSSSTTHHKHETEDVHTEFKARPAAVLHQKPFQVKKSDKSTTKFLNVKLNTEVRAEKRLTFDQHNKASQEEKLSIEAQIAEKYELKQQQEIAKLRVELVHKPLPLPKNVYEHKQLLSEKDLDD